MHRFILPIVVLGIVSFLPLAYAQHHSGQQAPPISFGDGKVTVNTMLIPEGYTPDEGKNPNLKIRFFDASTNSNIESVTYRVQIFYGSQLVANQMFFDRDGELDIKIQPKSDCNQEDLWKCTKYHGESDPIVPNAITSSASSVPVIIGPVFDKTGTYTVKTSIIGAMNPRTQTSEDINFETNVMIPYKETIPITMGGYQYNIIAKKFADEINGIMFDQQTNSIRFKMPVSWEHAEHTESIQASFDIPKDFPPYSNVQSFTAEINGISLSPTDTHFDRHASNENNIIYFAIPGSELVYLKNTSDIEKDSSVEIAIAPEIPTSIMTKDVQFDNGYRGIFSYDSRYGQNKEVLFTIEFFDSSGNRASDIRYAYSIKDTLGKETINMGGNSQLLGIMLADGIDRKTANAPHEGKYTIQFVLIGKGQNDFERYSYKSVDYEMKATESKAIPLSPAAQSRVPEWVKNNAKWWADGSIDDNSFVQGIQFLIKEKILNVKTSGTSGVGSQDIPAWIKNNAKWWADGMIGEEDFLNGIEHLVNAGILKAN